jgi:hypothetical protein
MNPKIPIMKRHDLNKRSRSCPVTSLSFGKDRKVEYPDFFFCHGCDQLEDAVLSNIKGACCEMKKYMCTGGHAGDVSHPTTLKKQYRPNLHASSKKPQKNQEMLIRCRSLYPLLLMARILSKVEK